MPKTNRNTGWLKYSAALLVSTFLCSCSTPPPPPPATSYRQMYDDYDFMVQMLRDTYPAADLNRRIYNVNTYKILAEYRTRINDKMMWQDFALLVDDALRACKGELLQVNPSLSQLKENKTMMGLIHGFVSEDAIDETEYYHLYMQKARPIPEATVELLYHDGAYYSKHDFSVNGVEYKRGMKLAGVNGVEPAKIIAKLQDKLTKFDYKQKVFYGIAQNKIQDNFYLCMPAANPARFFKFEDADGKELTLEIGPESVVKNHAPTAGILNLERTVAYLLKEKIFYVRMSNMDIENIPFYKDEISRLLPGKEVKAAVIDIRGNTRGDDSTWAAVMEFFVSQIDVSFSLGGNTSDYAAKYMEQYLKVSNNANFIRSTDIFVPFVGLHPLHLYTLSAKGKTEGRDIPTYILTHDVSASAGNLLAFAGTSGALTTVGTRNPIPLGMETTPFFVSLPYSKLIISMRPLVDLTKCRSAAEVLHVNVDAEVELTAATRLDYLNHDKIDNLEKYLVAKDPYFRKVLDLMNPPPPPPPAKPAEEPKK